MKIIISERQYNHAFLRRRFYEILNEALLMIADDGAFYGDIDFCWEYPTFYSFMEDMVAEITRHYDYNYGHDIAEFIYGDIGVEKFIKLLLDERGNEIKEFYDLKTKDC